MSRHQEVLRANHAVMQALAERYEGTPKGLEYAIIARGLEMSIENYWDNAATNKQEDGWNTTRGSWT